MLKARVVKERSPSTLRLRDSVQGYAAFNHLRRDVLQLSLGHGDGNPQVPTTDLTWSLICGSGNVRGKC
jgi:hypothetical protein